MRNINLEKKDIARFLIIANVLLVFILFGSCKKENKNNNVVPQTTTKVYVFGNVWTKPSYTKAVMWVDGKQTDLSNDSVYWSQAHFACTFDTNIYVCGLEGSGLTGGQRATLWVNGIPKQLGVYGKSMSQAYCVAASKNLVCVVGEIDGITRLWKNDEEIILDNIKIEEYQGRRYLFVDGTDIYIVGTKLGCPILWKNGVITYLYDNVAQGGVQSVFIESSNVYVLYSLGTGTSKRNPFLWKNGLSSKLSDSSSYYSLYVSNNDIYLGSIMNSGTISKVELWKNGIRMNIDTPSVPPSTFYASIPLFINTTDNYIISSQQQNSNSYKTYIWKNGENSTLYSSTVRAIATSIFVK